MDLQYDISRIPIINPSCFQVKSDSTDPSIILSRDETENMLKQWYLYFMDTLNSGRSITVAELRRRAGLEVNIIDYYFGFDSDCLSYTGTHGIDVVKFHPIHLKQILKPNLNNIDVYSLTTNEDCKDIVKFYYNNLALYNNLNPIQATRVKNLALEYYTTEKDSPSE